MKTKLLLLTLFISSISFAQYTAIPDTNFENALSAYDDFPNDGQVPTANISVLTSLNVSSQNISDLTGIQDFTALKVLNCKTNNLTSLNITSNLNLQKLYCNANQLSALNTSNNTLLTQLYCHSNLITVLDVSLNVNLIRLYCQNNLLTNLNTSTNINLLRLYCQSNQIGSLNISTNTLLKYLYCQSNLLTVLNTSTNTDLLRIYCDNNQITSLDVSGNPSLLYLYCYGNQLTNLNTNNNLQLQRLYCYSNQISSLNTSNNTNLIRFYCNSNLLTSLDVSANTSLTFLRCQNNQINNLVLNPSTLIELNASSNQLTTIDVSAHINLQNLYLHVNQFTDLDVSSSVNLVRFYCQSNQLTTLNVKNGNNPTITAFKSFNNPNLTCIEVDNIVYSTTNWTQIDSASSFNTNCHYGGTFVPDTNFETYLETHDASGSTVAMGSATSMGNGVMDDYVFTNRIDTVNILQVSNLTISDLTGIEDFTALTQLYCDNNQIASLDVSQNTNLQYFSCGNNQLTALDVTQNINLIYLNCSSNNITNLNLNFNPALGSLYCYDNLLATIDVSNNPLLNIFYCNNNQLTSLDVSQNLALNHLYCNDNLLVNIDVSLNTSLILLHSFNNLLTDLNVKNGNNVNFLSFGFKSYGNPGLICIEVDDVAYSTTNWTQIDPASSFNTNCANPETFVPDTNFETYLETHDASGAIVAMGSITSMGNGVMDDYVTTANINIVTNLDVNTLNIANMTGIEDFIALTQLNCYNNQIINLDISTNTALTQLTCYSNQLVGLDVSTNTALTHLNCHTNQLTSLNVSTNIALTHLACLQNQIVSLDVTQNTSLVHLDCTTNQLTSLDLTHNTALLGLLCANNQLTSLNVKNGNNINITLFYSTNNPNLTCIEVDNATYSTTNWTNIDTWTSFNHNCTNPETFVPDTNFETYLETHDANGTIVAMGSITSMGNGVMDDYVTTANINTVTNLDVNTLNIVDMTGIEDFTLLEELYCHHNQIVSLDITQNLALLKLDCNNNQLTSLNTSNNNALSYLYCFSNPSINSLSLANNISLQTLICSGNGLTSLDVSNNLQLTDLICPINAITSLDVSLNINLVNFNVANNSLTSLNINNGTNTNIINYSSNSNPNLICIEVDDPLYSTTNWINVDSASTFSNNCPSTCSYPTNLSSTLPSVTGATLSWQENGTASVWDLKIGIQGFNPNFMPPTHENVTNPFIWTGGILNTSYDFYVRADCSGNNTVTSAWEGPFTFSTISICESGDFTLDNTTTFNGVMKSAIAFADIDGDNDQDVLITGTTTTNIEIAELYTNNAGVFTLVAGTPFTGVSDGDVAFADIDNDGDQDLVISGRTSGVGSINLYLNNGSGVFVLDLLNSFTASGFESIAFADVDANGYKDLVITGYGSTSLYKNNAGTFTLDVTTSFQALGKSSTDFADVDNDGDQDLIISGVNSSQYFTKLYFNNGSGVFTLSASVSPFQGVFRGDNEFSDIDNDGDLDFLITGYKGGTYYSNLYRNNGSGTFTLITGTPFTSIFASSVAFGDVDSDGDQDLIISGLSSGSGRITKLYNNDGSGVFTEILGTPFDGTDSGSLAFADIDNDFDVDVLITGQNVSGTRIAKLYLNNSYYNTEYTSIGWTNGLPTLNKCAIIDFDFTTISFSAYKTTVNATKTLTVAANTFMQVQQDIINNGTITVEATGSVVQIDDTSTVTGSGTFNTKIKTTPLQDYTRFTYFSSPSATETLNSFSSWGDLNYLWEFNETIQDWDYLSNSATPMQAGNGYIVRGSSSNTYPAFVGATNFQNAYNNGVITQSLHFKGDGSLTANLDNDSNLVGNPYPSAINGTKLLNASLNPTAGTLYFWTHNSGLVSGQFSTDDYAMWNLSGGTVAISGGAMPTGFIASGQGFFIEAEGDETITLNQEIISTLTFNNDMRETGNNTDFRRPTNPEFDKIWLNLSNENGVFNQTLLSFLPNTTTAYDNAYDGKRNINGVATFYSVGLDNQHYGIQALPLLQDETVIPLGYQIEDENITTLSISIDHFENMQNVTVYLVDNLLNITHDLNQEDYTFSTVNETGVAGVFDSRFEIVFNNSALSTNDISLHNNLIVSNQKDNSILVKVNSTSVITNLEVYDTLGKTIIKVKPNDTYIYLPSANINQGTILFIKAKLENGEVLNKKFIKI